MESSRVSQAEAQAALEGAAQAQRRLVAGLELPVSFSAWIGGAVALQLGTVAIAVGHDTSLGRVVLVLGVVQLLAAGWWQSRAFKQRHGVWVAGLVDAVVLGVDPLASLAYAAGIAGALVAGANGLWALGAVAAVSGGAGYALAGRRWFTKYAASPERYGRGIPAWLSIGLALVAVVGLAALVANG
jgi:hypothetical protein